MESRVNCAGARRHLAAVKAAAPEVLTAIRTKQLAQELLLYKEDHLQDIAKTGALLLLRARARPGLPGRARGPRARGRGHAHCLAALPRDPVCYALGRRPSRGAHVGLLAAGLVDDGRVDALAAPAPEPLAHQCASAPLCQPQTACAQGTDPTLCT